MITYTYDSNDAKPDVKPKPKKSDMIWVEDTSYYKPADRAIAYLLYVDKETESVHAIVEERLVRESDKTLYWEARTVDGLLRTVEGLLIGFFLTREAAKKAVEEYV